VVILLLPVSFAAQYLTVRGLRLALSGVGVALRRPIEALASDITGYGALLGMVVLFVRGRRHAKLASLGLRAPEWRWLVAAVPFTALAVVVGSITGLLSQSLFPHTPANQCVSLRSAYGGAIWLAVIGVAVVAPFVEEVIFRGMVFGWLRGRIPIAWAVVVSAAVFSLEHIGFLEVTLFLPIFAAGVVLAILYHHAQSIWPNVVVHGGFNLIATLVLLTGPGC
jgi:membrane protease YdiL (CAAX protease family)